MPRIIRTFVSYGKEKKVGDEITLSGEESHHLSKVLRLQPESTIEVLNGMGNRAQVHCLDVREKEIRTRINSIECCLQQHPLIRVAVALVKGKKWGELIRPLTELGAYRITPLITDRTQVRDDSSKFPSKALKWKRYAIEACKQSGNPWLPEIDYPTSFSTFLSDNSKKERRFLASLSDPASPFPNDQGMERIALLIGPEGGWSQEEECLAQTFAVEPFSLAGNILRTETAAVSALAVAKALKHP